MSKLLLSSRVKLPSGNTIPLLGLGVYQNVEGCYSSCLSALKHGYRHIDGAEMYDNEEDVGRAMRDSGIKREDIFVTSKIRPMSDDPAASIDGSLQKMGLEYIDLYLIHSAHGGKTWRLEAWKALLEAKRNGKVRDVGVSNYGIKHIQEIKDVGLEMPAVNQIELHPLNQQKEIVDYCKVNNILIEAYHPLLKGTFDNSVLLDVSKKTGKSPAQVLVRWSLQSGYILFPKSSKPERIAQNADVYNFELSNEDMAALNALDRGDDGAIGWNPITVD